MALTVVDHPRSAADTPEVFAPPPPVVVTPCDPWPRPYYLEGGLRRVHPYHYTYNTNCKARWRDREILEIFTDEFRDRPAEYYVCPARTTPISFQDDAGRLIFHHPERRHRIRRSVHQRQTSPFNPHHRPQRRRNITHDPPARAARDRSTHRRRPRR